MSNYITTQIGPYTIVSMPIIQLENIVNRHISKYAFRNRFTPEEQAVIEWAATDKPDESTENRQISAALRADLENQKQAKFIDLDDTAVTSGLQRLTDFGILANGRMNDILLESIQDNEKP